VSRPVGHARSRPPERLPRDFYARDTVLIARELLGKLVSRRLPGGELLLGRIVETEAYSGPEDRASHASRGLTPRTRLMFGPPGIAYVYQIYGMWFCLNAVTGPEGFPAAVLLRAAALPGAPRAAAGPGKLCRALSIDKRQNGADLVLGEELWLADDGLRPSEEAIAAAPRVGVDYAGEWAERPWRFFLSDHPEVSVRPRRKVSVRPRRK
jgi:DNA-3-methyladenine glycosylase